MLGRLVGNVTISPQKRCRVCELGVLVIIRVAE